MATIKDVARLANVSIATVSRVINHSPKAGEAAREAVRKAMDELGYRPNANARALVSGISDTMGCMVFDVSDPFFGAMLKAIETVAWENHKHLLIGNGLHNEQRERETLELLISKSCDALIVHSKALSDAELLNYARQVPGLVLINRYIPAIAERCVWLDNRYGSYAITQHLIELGHTRIACVASKYEIDDTMERIAGYRQAMQESGLATESMPLERAEPNEEGGEQAMQNLLGRGQPFSAVVAYNDAMATGVISVLADNGLRVPEDVSVVGFDDVIFARYFRPKLTTMRYPISMMAGLAARIAIQLAKGEQPDQSPAAFRPVLVRRQSSSFCPAGHG